MVDSGKIRPSSKRVLIETRVVFALTSSISEQTRLHATDSNQVSPEWLVVEYVTSEVSDYQHLLLLSPFRHLGFHFPHFLACSGAGLGPPKNPNNDPFISAICFCLSSSINLSS